MSTLFAASRVGILNSSVWSIKRVWDFGRSKPRFIIN
jgi:hypothetical protein